MPLLPWTVRIWRPGFDGMPVVTSGSTLSLESRIHSLHIPEWIELVSCSTCILQGRDKHFLYLCCFVLFIENCMHIIFFWDVCGFFPQLGLRFGLSYAFNRDKCPTLTNWSQTETCRHQSHYTLSFICEDFIISVTNILCIVGSLRPQMYAYEWFHWGLSKEYWMYVTVLWISLCHIVCRVQAWSHWTTITKIPLAGRGLWARSKSNMCNCTLLFIY